MRRIVALVALACASAILFAVLIPLGVVIRDIAKDRAIASATRQITPVVAVLGSSSDRASVTQALDELSLDAQYKFGAHLPDGPPVGFTRLQPDQLPATKSGDLAMVRVDDGLALVQPLVLGAGGRAAVEVHVTNEMLTKDVGTVWAILAGMAVLLMAGAVALVDRLAIRLVRQITKLAAAARTFGQGDLTERIEPSGPTELVDASIAFNVMAERITALRASERELAADLSHRLRTPLAALRLDADRLGAGPHAERVRHAATLIEHELDGMIHAARRPLSARGPDHCDLAAVVAQRMGFWAPLAEDERRKCALFSVNRPVAVAVARDAMAAAIDVVIGNVFRHTRHGTPFAVRLAVAGSRAVLCVEDAGPGIADPHEALRRGGSSGSTGLGLDIARRVAESTGGTILIGRSTMGGARVELYLAVAFAPATLNLA